VGQQSNRNKQKDDANRNRNGARNVHLFSVYPKWRPLSNGLQGTEDGHDQSRNDGDHSWNVEKSQSPYEGRVSDNVSVVTSSNLETLLFNLGLSFKESGIEITNSFSKIT
jgi:hypothetical protein